MNPFVQLLFIGFAVFCVIVVFALICSVAVLAMGKRYAQKQYAALKAQLTQLLNGDEALAARLLEGEQIPEDCQNREQIDAILEQYRQEQERIQTASRELREKRAQKRRVLKFLTEKKDKLL